MKFKSILSSVLAFSMLFGTCAFAEDVATTSPESDVRKVQTLNVDFQSDEWYAGDHPVSGNYLNGMVAQGNSTVTVHEDAETGNRYASCVGGYLGADTQSMETVYISLDFMFGTSSSRLGELIRGSLSAANSCQNIWFRDGNFGVQNGSKWVNLGKYSTDIWYHMEYTVHMHNETYDIKITDENGNTYSAENHTFRSTGYTSLGHIRFAPSGTVYLDNFVYEEDITLPKIESVSDESGNTDTVDYTSQTVTVTMTKPLLAVAPEDVALTNKRTGEVIPVDDVALDGNSVVITPLMPLQSANEYEIRFSDALKMNYLELPIGKSLSSEFATSLRPLDVSYHSFDAEGESVNLSMKIKNEHEESRTATVMLVLYDSDMRIVSLANRQITALPGDEADVDLSIVKKAESGNVKAFVFTDFANPSAVDNNIYTFSY